MKWEMIKSKSFVRCMFWAVFNKLGKGPAFMVILGELCPRKVETKSGRQHRKS